MDWYILAIGCAFLTAAANIVEKKTLMKEHAMSFSTSLAIMNVIVSLFFLTKINLNIPTPYYFYIYIASLFGTFGYLLFAKAFRHMEISIAAPLLNFSPAILAILSYFFLGEGVGVWQMVGIFFLIVGAYIVEVDHNWKTLKDPFVKMFKSTYVKFIFIGLILYSVASLLDRFILRTNSLGVHVVDPISYVFIAQLFICFNFIILSVVYYDGLSDIKVTFSKNIHWIFIIAIFSVGYRVLQAQAMAVAFASLVIPIKRTSTLITTIFGGRMFHEEGLGLKIIGTVILLFGACLIVGIFG
jgi:drug/metabolite transporter (DMT)-like permease